MYTIPWRLSPLIVGLVLLFSLAGVAQTAEPRDPYRHFFHDSFGDLGEELATARAEGKKGLLIFFEMDECPFCHRMKQTVLNQPQVQDYYREHFRSISVDVEGGLDITDFDGNVMKQNEFAFKKHRVRATPVFVFFDLEGKPVARYTGPTKDVEEFLWLGEYVADERYRELPFARYKRERQERTNGQ